MANPYIITSGQYGYPEHVFWPVQLWPVSITEIVGKTEHPFEIVVLALLREFTTKTGWEEIEKHSGFSRRMVERILARLLDKGLITKKQEISEEGLRLLQDGVIVRSSPGYKLITSCYGNKSIMGLISDALLSPPKTMYELPEVLGDPTLIRNAPPANTEVKKFISVAQQTGGRQRSDSGDYATDSAPIPSNLISDSVTPEDALLDIRYRIVGNQLEPEDPFSVGGFSWFYNNLKHLESAVEYLQRNR